MQRADRLRKGPLVQGSAIPSWTDEGGGRRGPARTTGPRDYPHQVPFQLSERLYCETPSAAWSAHNRSPEKVLVCTAAQRTGPRRRGQQQDDKFADCLVPTEHLRTHVLFGHRPRVLDEPVGECGLAVVDVGRVAEIPGCVRPGVVASVPRRTGVVVMMDTARSALQGDPFRYSRTATSGQFSALRRKPPSPIRSVVLAA